MKRQTKFEWASEVVWVVEIKLRSPWHAHSYLPGEDGWVIWNGAIFQDKYDAELTADSVRKMYPNVVSCTRLRQRTREYILEHERHYGIGPIKYTSSY